MSKRRDSQLLQHIRHNGVNSAALTVDYDSSKNFGNRATKTKIFLMLFVMRRTLYQSRGADAIANLEAFHTSAKRKKATEITDEIGLHTDQFKPADACTAINRLTDCKFKPFNCLSA